MEPDCGHFCQEGDHILEFTPLPGTLTGVLCRGNTEALCTAVWRHLEAHYELEAIERGDRQTVRKLLKEAYERADRGSRRRAIEDALTYFLRQWGGVEAWSQVAGGVGRL